ncbi:Uncharacterised protein [Raoultella ornithinolytica]|nr:Uncharacterised protein [Raoultella ornithinolytica]
MSGRDAVPNEAGKKGTGRRRGAFAQAGRDTRHDPWILYGD